MNTKEATYTALQPVRVYKDGIWGIKVEGSNTKFLVPSGTEIVIGTTTHIYSGELDDYEEPLKFNLEGKDIEINGPILFLSKID